MCYMRILDAECFQGNARDVMYMYHRNLQVTLFLYIPFLSHLISAILIVQVHINMLLYLLWMMLIILKHY
jgi:hypothetical protein